MKNCAVQRLLIRIAKFEQWLNVDNIYVEGGIRTVHHIEQALKAEFLFKRDKDYIVDTGEIIIIDEFTGRKIVIPVSYISVDDPTVVLVHDVGLVVGAGILTQTRLAQVEPDIDSGYRLRQPTAQLVG